MNLHEYQAKELLKKFGAPVSKGVVIYNLNEIDDKNLRQGLEELAINVFTKLRNSSSSER